jgi:hypothetical protein
MKYDINNNNKHIIRIYQEYIWKSLLELNINNLKNNTNTIIILIDLNSNCYSNKYYF